MGIAGVGSSRIWAPVVEDYLRDVVQVKGGVSDYYVLGEIDYLALRKEQYRPAKKPEKFVIRKNRQPTLVIPAKAGTQSTPATPASPGFPPSRE